MRKVIGAMTALGLVLAAGPAFGQDRIVIVEEERVTPTAELGVVAGFPTGLSGKLWLTPMTALQAGLAWQFGTGAMVATGDYLVHSRSLIDSPEMHMPLYVGAGLRLISDNVADDAIGPRIPVGVQAIVQDIPVSVFAEIAPGAEFEADGDTTFTADAAVGARVYF